MKQKQLIVITGPTAVGKTECTLQLAERHGLEIVSADSRQLYQEMTIGTAKPSSAELQRAVHHFINSHSITEGLSAGEYEREAMAVLKDCFSRRDTVILTGGSGLYIKAVCEGLDEFPAVPAEVLEEVSELSLEILQKEIGEVDPKYYLEVDLSNKRRLVRAVSVMRVSGKTYSSFRKRAAPERAFSLKYVVLERDRSALYTRINLRVDRMMEDGLVEEVKGLNEYRGLKPLQTVGYSEIFAHLDGEYSLGRAVELIKRNSRRYAKRQLTWFRSLENAEWIHPDEFLKNMEK